MASKYRFSSPAAQTPVDGDSFTLQDEEIVDNEKSDEPRPQGKSVPLSIDVADAAVKVIPPIPDGGLQAWLVVLAVCPLISERFASH